MAIGDAALGAGMDILTGMEDRRNGWQEINKTRDYLATKTNDVTPVAKGGTGASTAAAARTNLSVPSKAELTDGLAGKAAASHTHSELRSGNMRLGAGSGEWNTAQGLYADSYIGTGGSYFTYGATPVTSGYVSAWINSDGRIGKSASSRRFKEHIEAQDPEALGDIWPDLARFQMLGGDGSWKYGYIAEELAAHPDQARFVVYESEVYAGEDGERHVRPALDEHGELIPESIDFFALLMTQNAQLHQQLDLLAQRLTELENR